MHPDRDAPASRLGHCGPVAGIARPVPDDGSLLPVNDRDWAVVRAEQRQGTVPGEAVDRAGGMSQNRSGGSIDSGCLGGRRAAAVLVLRDQLSIARRLDVNDGRALSCVGAAPEDASAGELAHPELDGIVHAARLHDDRAILLEAASRDLDEALLIGAAHLDDIPGLLANSRHLQRGWLAARLAKRTLRKHAADALAIIGPHTGERFRVRTCRNRPDDCARPVVDRTGPAVQRAGSIRNEAHPGLKTSYATSCRAVPCDDVDLLAIAGILV